MPDQEVSEAEGRLRERVNELIRAALTSANTPLTLSEIEEIALSVRAQVGEAVTQTLVKQQASPSVPGPVCDECGVKMHYKGVKKRRLVTRSAEVDWERAYYYCPRCRRGIFPPR